jgi:DNA-binding SARP family transcriptional activator/tetratricopeptide (TPR) repeat protein
VPFVRFGLLGPLDVELAGQPVRIARRQERCVLAILLLEAGRPVSTDRLAELTWAGQPPAAARDVVQTYISRLRTALNPPGVDVTVPVTRRGHTYVIEIDPQLVDVYQFERAVEDALASDVAADRSRLLRRGLALWRGPALADIGPDAVRERLAARLEEARLRALDLRIAADLSDGRHAEIVGELIELAARSPQDERLAAHVMLALHRCGRRSEALRAYQTIRRCLADELGLDPGSELQALHSAILRGDPELVSAVAAAEWDESPRPPAQLPAAVPEFSGRDAQVVLLDALLPNARVTTGSAPNGGALVLSLIAGPGGVGKTALAVWWGRRVAHLFPAGQLFVDLRGFGPGPPVRPIDALGAFLRALHVPPERIPTDVDEASALYRSLLAGRRTLVVLDNAGSADQVRPLLPGDPACLVIATSRSRLGSLAATHGARRLVLDPLAERDALNLLGRLIGGDRIDADPLAATRLAALCAYLPLALRIAAAQLIDSPHQTVADYVSVLEAAGPLDRLATADDDQIGVRPACDASYTRLTQDEQRLLRLLGLAPGADTSLAAAAALVDMPAHETRRLMDRLAAAHLVGEPMPGRYRLHDLLRMYAIERAQYEDTATDRDTAVTRLLTWYLHTTDAAARLLYPQMVRLDVPPAPAGASPVPFDDRAGALAWLEAERTNLLAAVKHAAGQPSRALSWQLADALRGFVWQSRLAADWLDATQIALAAAGTAGNLRAQAALHLGLGTVHLVQDRTTEAIGEYAVAAELAERDGWVDGQAASVGNLGNTHMLLGSLRQAAGYQAEALRLYRRSGRIIGQANTLGNLGVVERLLGDLAQALEHHTEALARYEQTGAPAIAIAMNNVGEVEHMLGRFESAERRLTTALDRHRSTGNRYGEAESLHSLAALLLDAGRQARAFDVAQTGLALTRRIADHRLEARLLNVLGTLHLGQGRPREAVDHHTEALRLAREAKTYGPEVEGLLGLAAAHRDLHDRESATARATEALNCARRAGYRLMEGQALSILATIDLAAGDQEPAIRYIQQALDTFRETGYRLGEACATRLMGEAVDALDGSQAAEPYRRRARELFADIGAPEPDAVAPARQRRR